MGNYLDIYYNTILATACTASHERSSMLSVYIRIQCGCSNCDAPITYYKVPESIYLHSANCRVYITITSKSLPCRRIHHSHRYFFA